MTIPGIGPKRLKSSSPKPVATWAGSRPTEQLAAWVGVAPAMNESARHRSPAGTRQGNKWLTSMLVEAATAASHTKNTYLGSQFARLASRRNRNRLRLRSRARSWSALTTCCNVTSPTTIWDRSGSSQRRPGTHPSPRRATGSTRVHRRVGPSQLTAVDTDIRAAPGCCRLPAQSHFSGQSGESDGYWGVGGSVGNERFPQFVDGDRT